MLKHGSLYSGIGGWLLSAQWAGIDNVFTCEIDKFCNKVLDKHFPDTDRHHDIKETDFTQYAGRIDILSTSDPCQPFSFAGKRGGTSDDRFLWPETIRVIREVKPPFVVFENVPGFISMAFETVASDLEAEGYTVESFIIPACGVGAWHRRNRLWVIAYSPNAGIENMREREINSAESGGNNNVSDTNITGLEGWEKTIRQEKGWNSNAGYNRENTGSKWGNNQWTTEPNVGGRLNGLPIWLHRHIIKGYGTEESTRRTEILRELWNDNVSQTIWQVIGGFNRVQKSEVLFAIVCEYEKDSDKARLFMESEKAFKGFVRSLWKQEKITGSSHRPKNKKQHEGEYPNPMQTLSRLLAHDLQENWQISSWEDGIPRVESGTNNRVDRLKSLGNSIVPQIAYIIFEAIKEVNSN